MGVMEAPKESTSNAHPKDGRVEDRTEGVCSVLHVETQGVGERAGECVSVTQGQRRGQRTGGEFVVSHIPAGEWRRRECVGGWKRGGRIGELCSVSHPKLQEWRRGRKVCVSCYSQDWESGGQRQGRENGRREEKASGQPSSPFAFGALLLSFFNYPFHKYLNPPFLSCVTTPRSLTR